MKKFDIVALGEILIDYTSYGKSEKDMMLFEQNPGGAPANMLVCATKLGKKAAFIGKIGDDMQGAFLKKTLENQSIDTRGLIVDKNYFTTLAFVSVDENGERNFAFARKPGADTMLSKEEVLDELVEDTKVFHFGSLSLTDDMAREATLYAVKKAKENGSVISYDPNYRAPLWSDVDTATKMMRMPLDLIDVLKISDEETELLSGEKDPVLASKILIEKGIPVVLVTLGADGALVSTKEGTRHISGFKPDKIADTNGAGDSFFGGFMYSLINLKTNMIDLKLGEVCHCAKFGNAVASLCVEKSGAIPAMPTLEEVNVRLGK